MVTRETIVSGLEVLGFGPDVSRAAELLEVYGRLLREVAIPAGFLGPSEGDRIIERHLLESAAVARLAGEGGSLVDIGSGAGLPGMAIACLGERPMVLVESMERRVAFLRRAASELGLDVRVVRGRAEDFGRNDEFREQFDIGVARAVAPPPVTLELLLPLVRVGGRCVLPVGAIEEAAVEAAGRASAVLGGGEPSMQVLEVPGAGDTRYAMIVVKEELTIEQYPRRAGVPERRPLGGGVGGEPV